MISVNCAAIPESLIESELFGHEKGAFTGAISTKRGKFSLADRGSIFLDEIGTMSAGTAGQAVARAAGARNRASRRGTDRARGRSRDRGDQPRPPTTGRTTGRFQDDLFYRLHVVPIVVPPLRERLEDIPMLVEYFAQKHATRCGKCIDSLEEGVMTKLQEYHWPGNVRELENAVERAVVLTIGSAITREAVTVGGTASVQHVRRALFEAAPECRTDRDRDDSPGARSLVVQGTSRQAHGHQPTSPFLLPRQVPIHRPERSTSMRFAKIFFIVARVWASRSRRRQ